MIHLALERFFGGKDSSLGLLWQDREWLCFVLEDQHQDVKIANETRIPAGDYWLELRKEGGFHNRYSARFEGIHKGMILIKDIPGFSHVLIHCGNTDDHTAGCLLVGDGAHYKNGEATIQSSTVAYRRIYPPIAAALEEGQDVVLSIKDNDRS